MRLSPTWKRHTACDARSTSSPTTVEAGGRDDPVDSAVTRS